MRPIPLIIAIAAVAALLTGFLAKLWLDRQAARPASEPLATIEVLVLAHDLPAGSQLSASDLRYDRWPSQLANPRLFIRQGGEDQKAQAVGQMTRRPLSEGEPFALSATFRADSGGVLAGLLSPGMRAVSVAISNASAVSGFVMPGDRVDVVMSADVSKVTESAERKGAAMAQIRRFATETVVEDVKVLAVDQQIAKGRDASIQGKTATLEVTPKQAEVIATAAMMGNLNLALRSLPGAPAQPSDPMGFTSDIEISKALQVMTEPRDPAAKSGGGWSVSVNRGGRIENKGSSP